MPGTEVILVIISIVFLLVFLYTEILRPALTFLIAIIFLTLTGVLSPGDAISGFANEQLAVIVMLLILSDIIRKSSIMDYLFDRMLGKVKGRKGFMSRMMIYVASFSAFFNNTPLVAMMIPFVHKWASKKNVSPSKLMIPLSYAAILGGCATLIGTSTNLVVNGMAVDAGFESLNVFDFSFVGVPMLIIGVLFLVIWGNRLLPDHSDVIEDFVEHSRKYFIETKIKTGSKLVGKTIEEADLRNLKDLFLVEIIRQDKKITPVSPEEILEEDDTLIFTGNTDSIDEITKPSMGLSLPRKCEPLKNDRSDVIEVVVSYNSSLIGKEVMDTDFRGKYDAGIVAIHRNGEKLTGKIGEVELKAGDVLLVLGGKDFYKRTVNNQAFYIISQPKELNDVDIRKVGITVLGVITAIVLSSLNIIPLFSGLLVVLAGALLMNIVPLNEIRKGMDFNLILLIALGLAFGKAMINSGAASYMSEYILFVFQPMGVVGMLAGLFLIANLLSAYITNKAAVAIVFPISMSIAATMEVNVVPFILIVAFGAAANFITPIGYQTNLMVYGPGGYSFKDFFKIGLPITIIYMLVCVAILSYVYIL